ncbi:DUF424 domain-containing protein [Methanohalobium sp.]|uniref:DUF424 domain-containing protein n=1 Tax=Methanohalobium sp. TaxID=2837493 RepID=UPI0025DE263D|nr:DUF424 family protein [Methanohalobium sp.]
MYLKIHQSSRYYVVAVCDEDILGKTLKEGNLTVEISEQFYKGKTASESEVIEALSIATTANIFGEESVACAIKCSAVDPENVIRINNVPHAQIFRV